MERIKLFTGTFDPDDKKGLVELESEVNQWLAKQEDIEILLRETKLTAAANDWGRKSIILVVAIFYHPHKK